MTANGQHRVRRLVLLASRALRFRLVWVVTALAYLSFTLPALSDFTITITLINQKNSTWTDNAYGGVAGHLLSNGSPFFSESPHTGFSVAPCTTLVVTRVYPGTCVNYDSSTHTYAGIDGGGADSHSGSSGGYCGDDNFTFYHYVNGSNNTNQQTYTTNFTLANNSDVTVNGWWNDSTGHHSVPIPPGASYPVSATINSSPCLPAGSSSLQYGWVSFDAQPGGDANGGDGTGGGDNSSSNFSAGWTNMGPSYTSPVLTNNGSGGVGQGPGQFLTNSTAPPPLQTPGQYYATNGAIAFSGNTNMGVNGLALESTAEAGWNAQQAAFKKLGNELFTLQTNLIAGLKGTNGFTFNSSNVLYGASNVWVENWPTNFNFTHGETNYDTSPASVVVTNYTAAAAMASDADAGTSEFNDFGTGLGGGIPGGSFDAGDQLISVDCGSAGTFQFGFSLTDTMWQSVFDTMRKLWLWVVTFGFAYVVCKISVDVFNRLAAARSGTMINMELQLLGTGGNVAGAVMFTVTTLAMLVGYVAVVTVLMALLTGHIPFSVLLSTIHSGIFPDGASGSSGVSHGIAFVYKCFPVDEAVNYAVDALLIRVTMYAILRKALLAMNILPRG